jgi:hypothetical protein
MRAVANHQPPAFGIEQLRVRVDVVSDLNLQGSGQQLPSTFPNEHVEQLPACRRGLVTGLAGLRDYFEHGRTFPNQR